MFLELVPAQHTPVPLPDMTMCHLFSLSYTAQSDQENTLLSFEFSHGQYEPVQLQMWQATWGHAKAIDDASLLYTHTCKELTTFFRAAGGHGPGYFRRAEKITPTICDAPISYVFTSAASRSSCPRLTTSVSSLLMSASSDKPCTATPTTLPYP